MKLPLCVTCGPSVKHVAPLCNVWSLCSPSVTPLWPLCEVETSDLPSEVQLTATVGADRRMIDSRPPLPELPGTRGSCG